MKSKRWEWDIGGRSPDARDARKEWMWSRGLSTQVLRTAMRRREELPSVFLKKLLTGPRARRHLSTFRARTTGDGDGQGSFGGCCSGVCTGGWDAIGVAPHLTGQAKGHQGYITRGPYLVTPTLPPYKHSRHPGLGPWFHERSEFCYIRASHA